MLNKAQRRTTEVGLSSLTVVGLSISLLGVGMAEATLMALAMSSQHTSIATAAALLGAFQLVISSTATPPAGAHAEGGALP